jgi:pyruvate dehydrogenase E1 component alpha subunit
MHFYDVPRGNFGGDGIVGGHLPIAAGIGYGIRLRNTDQVCLCFFGDGAVNEGAFHEALNVSALWNLPVVYVIENNRYGMGTSLDRASSVKDLYQRGSAYGIPRRDLNGMDLIAVRTVIGEAIDLARKEKRPTLIEAETYRYRGHSMSDPGKYRTKEEVEEMMKVDPVLQWSKRLMEQERFTQADLDVVDKEILAQIDDAVAFTEQSPDPSPESLYEDVYVRSPYIYQRSADKDPAWRAARREDRVPEPLPPFAPPVAPPQPAAPKPAAEPAAAQPAATKAGS